nr:sugar ABC transporter permease [Kineococcus rhizosphaerae]
MPITRDSTRSPAPSTVRPAPAVAAGPARRRRRGVRGGFGAFVFALPALVVFGFFSWGPIGRAVVMSFQRTNLVQGGEWVGWSNFSYVLADPLFATAVRNTLWFTLLAVVAGFPLPLLLAVLISEVRRRRGLFTALAFLPVVVPPVVAILLWRTLYDPETSGVFNTLLRSVGLPALHWLSDPDLAMPAIVVEATWASAGNAVVIYLAALTSVRTELYEAAELDGAGLLGRVRHVTLPQLRGVVLVMLLLQVVGTMQVFSEPYLFTGGGPENATTSVLLLVYDYAFVHGDFGAATAASVLLALALGLFSAGYGLATRRWSTR